MNPIARRKETILIKAKDIMKRFGTEITVFPPTATIRNKRVQLHAGANNIRSARKVRDALRREGKLAFIAGGHGMLKVGKRSYPLAVYAGGSAR